jgi:four helix bundle protein
MKTHKDLDIWNLAIELVVKIYKETKNFPKEEMYGLTSQLRRASVSVASNIAEGAARQSKEEFIRFVYYSLGSLSEIETQIIIANKIRYMKDENYMNDIELLRRKTLNFIKYLKSNK